MNKKETEKKYNAAEILDLNSENLEIVKSGRNSKIMLAVVIAYFIAYYILTTNGHHNWAVALVVPTFLIAFLLKEKAVANIKYGENKATINVNNKNYDIFVSQVHRIEYRKFLDNDEDTPPSDTNVAYEIRIHYNSPKPLILRGRYYQANPTARFSYSEFDYLFKFLTSKNGGGKIVECHEKAEGLFDNPAHRICLENMDEVLRCTAKSYQYYNDTFPTKFKGEMTTSFLDDRVVIQVPNNCFIAYYRDIADVSFDGKYFILQHKNAMNLKIHLSGDFSQAKQIAEQIQNKIK